MSLETATYIANLDPNAPAGLDQRSTADDHIRLVKATLLRTVPFTGPILASATEVNQLVGARSPVQAQIDSKLAIATGTAIYADGARSAVFANSSNTAGSATNAANATNAVHATNADFATNATHASTADSATNASHANSADSANAANTANSATTAGTASNANALGGQVPSYYTTANNLTGALPAAVLGNQSLSGNGYLVLPGGFLMQWGKTAGQNQGATVNYSFPAAFGTLYTVVCTPADGSAVAGGGWQIVGYDVNGFTVFSNVGNTHTFNWIAIGHT